LHGQCTDSVYIMGIIRFFFCYFCTDLVIMLYIGHLRKDLLVHHGNAFTPAPTLARHPHPAPRTYHLPRSNLNPNRRCGTHRDHLAHRFQPLPVRLGAGGGY